MKNQNAIIRRLSNLQQSRNRKLEKLLTRYCKMRGTAIVGLILPTITTVKVDGSLKQRLKYSQALLGSTLLRSLIFMGCREIFLLISDLGITILESN